VLQPEPIIQVDPILKNEAGLIGVEILPDFETSREFVITYTPAADLEAFYVSKFRLEEDGTATTIADPWLELPSRADTDRHYGGNVRFHGDHMYVALSDLDYVDLAQDLDVLAGSILRYNLDLSIPEDNPFPGSPIWAYGFRNTFDFAIASDGTVWGGENGHHQHDEINRIVSGGNYGFPVVLGYCDGYPLTEPCGESTANMIEPMMEFKFRTAPTGMVVYEADLMPELQGDIMMGGWHTGEVHRIQYDAENDTVFEEREQFFVPPEGVYASFPGDERQHLDAFGIVDVVVAPDGALLVLMTGANVGKMYRIAPEGALLNPANRVEMGEGRAEVDSPACSSSESIRPSSLSFLLFIVFVVVALGRRVVSRRRVVEAMSVLLVVGTVSLSATSAHAFGFDFGAKAGGTMSLYSGDNNLFMDSAAGLAVGPTMRLGLLPFFAIDTDLQYANKGAGHRFFDSRTSLNYVQLPVVLSGVLPLGLVSLRLFAGPMPVVLVGASVDGESVTENLRTFDVLLAAGLGVDVNTPAGTIMVEAKFERSFNTIYDDSTTPEGITTPTLFQNNIVVMAGFLF
jgi:glucose/arabinose dehydrogenase